MELQINPITVDDLKKWLGELGHLLTFIGTLTRRPQLLAVGIFLQGLVTNDNVLQIIVYVLNNANLQELFTKLLAWLEGKTAQQVMTTIGA